MRLTGKILLTVVLAGCSLVGDLALAYYPNYGSGSMTITTQTVTTIRPAMPMHSYGGGGYGYVNPIGPVGGPGYGAGYYNPAGPAGGPGYGYGYVGGGYGSGYGYGYGIPRPYYRRPCRCRRGFTSVNVFGRGRFGRAFGVSVNTSPYGTSVGVGIGGFGVGVGVSTPPPMYY